jgi:predicted Zn-dependent protease
MVDPIEELVQRWKQNPSAATTVALCDALRANPRGALVQQVGEFAKERHASDLSVLVSVARMYIEAGRFMDAQAVLVAAGKQAPREGQVYRWLGEVLLRRGDAERAEKVLERAIQLGARDPDVPRWLGRARSYRTMQANAGAHAVAADLAHAEGQKQPPAHGLPRFASQTDGEDTSTDVYERVGTDEIEVSALAPVPTAPPIPKRLESAFARPSKHPAAANGASSARHAVASAADQATVVARRPVAADAVPQTRPPAVNHFVVARGAVQTDARAYARAPDPILVPHPRDVLDALALAGVFETAADRAIAVAGWDRATHGPKRKGGPALVSGMVLFLAASIGVYFFYQHRRAIMHVQAEALLTTVEAQLHAARPETLADAEKELAQALQLESRSPRAALDWARERAMVGLVKSGADVAFEDAMARAKDVGVPEEKYAFAHVASFLFQGDTAGAAAALARWERPAAGDAWYQMVAGATLERAGDARARDRYATASKLDPELVPAQTALARAAAIEGDAQEAMRLARLLRVAMPERAEPVALVALAWARDSKREDTRAPAEVDEVAKREGELPAGLKFIPHAIAALGAIDKRGGGDARAEVQGGLAVAESPGAAVWLGTIALSIGDEALARKAALLALQLSAAYEPARALAARVALLGGRIDEALKATEDLDPTSPDVVVVHAASAYERVDADGVIRALEALAPEARKLPFLAALDLASDALAGRLRLGPAKLLRMAADDAPWGDLVAMDTALDAGDLASAGKIAARWGKDAESQPLRSLRLARLARYEGRLDAADALSQAALIHGTVTPRVLWERGYVLVAKGRAVEVGPLLARYPLVLGPLATWLGAYATASGGNLEAARARTSSIDPPPRGAPLEGRVVAAQAFGAMKDKRRGNDYVKDVLASGMLNPDLVAAALSLGLSKVQHGKRGPTYE